MSLLDILYPKHCPVCLSALPPGKALICGECVKKLRLVREPTCYKCGKPMRREEKEYCRNCREKMPPFESGIAWAEYSSKYIRRMLSQVKYHNGRQLLDYPCLDFGKRNALRVKYWRAEALIPVPVHPKKLLERGYNQAAEIAERLGKVWGIPVDDGLLLRQENTAAQKNLSERERALNLQAAFFVRPGKNRYGTVILVDDIYTTGATAAACTKALLSAGVKKVYMAALAIGRDR